MNKADDHIRTEPETNTIRIGHTTRGNTWEVTVIGDDPDKAATKAIEVEQRLAKLYGPPSTKEQLEAALEAEADKKKGATT